MLFKLFIKNSEDTENPAVRQAYGKFTGVFGIISNAILFIIKIFLGIFSGSIAVIADAVNNLSDAGSSVITLIAFKLAGKPADAEHPYGHARIEYISGLIVSCIISSIGVELLISSVEKIFEPKKTTYTLVGIIILLLSVLIKLFQGFVYRSAGKKIDSISLIASSADSINDVISTCVVLVGAIIGMIWNISLDGWFGCAVALFVIYSGIKLIIETSQPLLGEAPSDELVKQLEKKIMSYDGVIGIHDLAVHDYGFGRRFASVHAEVPAKTDIMVSHDIVDNIEFDVLATMNINLVIHMDPIENENPEVMSLRAKTSDLVKQIDKNITLHDFRVVLGASHTNLIFDVSVPFSIKKTDDEICEEITSLVHTLDVSYNTVITVDRNV